MSEWVKLGLTLLGFAVITWASVQQHEYRLTKIESSLTDHLKKHDEQNEQLQRLLTQIQVDLGKLAGRKD